MTKPLLNESAPPLTGTQWLICFIAAIGFAFDIYELLMLPLILRPAILELGGFQPGSPEFLQWRGLMFYVPAIAGGIFGLLGGYLTDRLGRRRVLTWSILLYAFSAFAAGYSTNLWMLLFFRCTTFIGVCVEFVAAVAWLAELFSNPRQRENVLGYTQAFSSVGGLLVAFVFSIAVAWSVGKPAPLFFGLNLPGLQLPAISLPGFMSFLGTIKDSHAAWRYTLMSGLIPAIPLIIIRPFLPESPAWQMKRDKGTLRRPNIMELFSPELARTTIVTTIMFACSYGAAFGAIQSINDIVPGLPETKAEAKHAVEEFAAKKNTTIDKLAKADKGRITKQTEQAVGGHVTKIQEVGGLCGRFALAILAVWIVSRQKLLRVFQLPGLILMPIIFAWAGTTSLRYLEIGMFIAGFFTVAQFSFWGNYLPRVYPVHLRGTGESFAANIGGRLIGTSFAFVTSSLAGWDIIPGESPAKFAYVSAGVAFFVYAVGSIACFWLPQPPAEDPES